MVIEELEPIMAKSDLTAMGNREQLKEINLNLLDPRKKYAVFFIPLGTK